MPLQICLLTNAQRLNLDIDDVCWIVGCFNSAKKMFHLHHASCSYQYLVKYERKQVLEVVFPRSLFSSKTDLQRVLFSPAASSLIICH